MVGGSPSGFRATWSLAAEQEAIAHTRGRAHSPAVVRESLDLLLGPTGEDPERFRTTSGADRQILADAAAAGARFVVTEDVDDFRPEDLASVGIAAVNPDLFLAERVGGRGASAASNSSPTGTRSSVASGRSAVERNGALIIGQPLVLR